MSDFTETYRLTESAVTKMLEAAAAKAGELGPGFGIGVVDAGGILRGYVLTENGTPLAFDSVMKKCKTAAFVGTPTGGLPDDLTIKLCLAIPDFAPTGGGFPIVKDGQVVGGIAAGGGEHVEDEEVAKAGLAAIGLE
jgi:uncharacterized protein GlcG (DUF336 family)